MPLSYVFIGGAVCFLFFLWPLASCFVGLWPFCNKLLLIQKKKEDTTRKIYRKPNKFSKNIK